MPKVNSDWKSKTESFYYCFYHVYTVKHVNYHHVILKLKPDEVELVNTLDCDTYQYRLISIQQLFLDEKALAGEIIRGLVMDGESLLKRIKAQQKKSISTENSK